MGNTTSVEESSQSTKPSANMQNNNVPFGAQGWGQPAPNNYPNNPYAPTAPTAPGWNLSTPQQTLAQDKERESRAPCAPYAPPPAYNSISSQHQTATHAAYAPQNPLYPQAQHLYALNQQHAHQQPQQYYAPQYPLPSNKFHAQPPLGSAPPSAPSTNFFAQPAVSSGQTFNNYSPSLPFNAMGMNSNIWVPANKNTIPANAFPAGHDSDRTPLFIVRANHAGDLIPGKVIPSTHHCAYVCHEGIEHGKHSFEVLVGERYRWFPSGGGHIPKNAVEGGRTSNGEKLYIGRVHHKMSLTPGKVHPSHKCLYIPYGGQEIAFDQYEILIHD